MLFHLCRVNLILLYKWCVYPTVHTQKRRVSETQNIAFLRQLCSVAAEISVWRAGVWIGQWLIRKQNDQSAVRWAQLGRELLLILYMYLIHIPYMSVRSAVLTKIFLKSILNQMLFFSWHNETNKSRYWENKTLFSRDNKQVNNSRDFHHTGRCTVEHTWTIIDNSSYTLFLGLALSNVQLKTSLHLWVSQ